MTISNSCLLKKFNFWLPIDKVRKVISFYCLCCAQFFQQLEDFCLVLFFLTVVFILPVFFPPADFKDTIAYQPLVLYVDSAYYINSIVFK